MFRSIYIMCLKPVCLDTSSSGKTSVTLEMAWSPLMIIMHNLLLIPSLTVLLLIHLLSIKTSLMYLWSEADTAMGELVPVDKKPVRPPLNWTQHLLSLLSTKKSQNCLPAEHRLDYMTVYFKFTEHQINFNKLWTMYTWHCACMFVSVNLHRVTM